MNPNLADITRDCPELAYSMELAEQIQPILAGKAPEIQGSVLMQLVGTWLAGHIVPGNPAVTQVIRGDILLEFVGAVIKFCDEESRRIHGAPR